MSTLNNGIATYQDIIDNGGIVHILKVGPDMVMDMDMCVRAKDMDTSLTTLYLPPFANTTFNTSASYTDGNQLVKYNDINIAETGTIYLGVDYPNTYSNYTIDGVIVTVEYPNGCTKTHVISVYNATGFIPIENCVIGAKVSINTSTLSGAYVRLGSGTAGIITTANSMFKLGAKVTVTNFIAYPCFTITKESSGGFDPVDPDPGIGDFSGGTGTVTATTRTIDVILNNITPNVNNITIGTSTYASGRTATNFGRTSNMNIKKVAYQSTVPIGKFAGATLTVPKNAYVQIKMGSISYSQNSFSQQRGIWDTATKVVSPRETRVVFTFNPGVIEK